VIRAVLSWQLLLPALLPAAACNLGKISRGECTQMLDRYVDMTSASDSEKALRKSDPRYVRVEQQCEAEITRREYRCAMKAPSPETWQACID
jgi:hypothetical protein